MAVSEATTAGIYRDHSFEGDVGEAKGRKQDGCGCGCALCTLSWMTSHSFRFDSLVFMHAHVLYPCSRCEKTKHSLPSEKHSHLQVPPIIKCSESSPRDVLCVFICIVAHRSKRTFASARISLQNAASPALDGFWASSAYTSDMGLPDSQRLNYSVQLVIDYFDIAAYIPTSDSASVVL